MDKVIYSLCAMTALTCAVLLLRTYRRTGFRLLLWSAMCFVGLTANNVLLVLDRLVLTGIDLTTWRLALGLLASLLLVTGLILETDE